MSLHEIKKGCKIIDELILYIMKNGHRKMDLSIDKTSDVLKVIIKTDKMEDSLLEVMDKYINTERELEVEEYGWELMGESDAQSELGMVGLLIDKLEIDNADPNHTTLIITRVDKY